MNTSGTVENKRLAEDASRTQNWKRWGPYLSERQWATVREDYSEHGNCWEYFPHDHARSRAYRWGEDGLMGFTDRQCRLCFALALWNGRDPILKERLFGLTGPEGNHGEDVKECYYYLDSTPTHSYAKALYKYPQAEFPYGRLASENAARKGDLSQREFELVDTGIFDEHRYFDVIAEYAKGAPEDICIRITIANRGPDTATLHVLPTLWFRNTWSWGLPDAGKKPSLLLERPGQVLARHPELGKYRLVFETGSEVLFTENDSNAAHLWKGNNLSPYVKDAFHRRVISGDDEAVNPTQMGTKCAPHFKVELAAGATHVFRLRLTGGKSPKTPEDPLGESFDTIFTSRKMEADEFFTATGPEARQAYAGLLWTKQYYQYIVRDWLAGDQVGPPPPESRRTGRNHEWTHVHCNDVLSMPDKWEYPWFAAWDHAFHMVPMAVIDPDFAKKQLMLLLREWYMHPNGQIAAYEFAFGDVNPPVHAWATWRVYKMTGPRGARDRVFLESVFQKLLLNFTWWVNRKDSKGHNLFEGGFLGLDNIGVFDRSSPLPTGGRMQQADGTAWMAFYSLIMLGMAMELAMENPVYEDLASKFFEHFVSIAEAVNSFGGSGLWDEKDGFYYDHLEQNGQSSPLRTRSLVGLLPLIAVVALEKEQLAKLPNFTKRMNWFIEHRQELLTANALCPVSPDGSLRLLALPSRHRLERALRYLLDESEFLSPHGIRSLSHVHKDHPFVFRCGNEEWRVDYTPGESTTHMFGGNSNWRGPIWFPINFLLIEALERYHYFYGDDLKVECPRGSGQLMNLKEVATELARRHASLFLPDATGARPCHGEDTRYATDPHWRDLVLFYEFFHADTGRGCGASHQTGWTALVVRYLEKLNT